jgi:mRNA interferase MazF
VTPAGPPSFPRRGEVYLLDFSPATGAEMAGLHPCVVVQNDVGNRRSGLTIVVAVTSNMRVASLPVGVFVPAGEGGLARDSVVHCGHIYTVDKGRLGRRLGDLPPDRMTEIEDALLRSLGF